jgi:hypothetical protein
MRLLTVATLLLIAVRPSAAEDSITLAHPLEAEDVARLEPIKIKELLLAAEDQIEITSKLDGAMLIDLRIGKPSEMRVRKVELEGRVKDTQQRTLVGRVVTIAMQAESFWNTSDDEFVVETDKLTVIPQSADAGAKNLGMAVDQFFAGQHENADKLLSLALVESPDREVIHYWKVANWLAMKQNGRAERRLELLSRRNPRGSDTYAGQLQRLQGPYRRAIIDLEQKVMLKSRLGTGIDKK